MKLVKVFALASLAALANAWAAPPATYRCERLNSSLGRAVGIDDRGVVTGSVEVPGDGYHPAVWRHRAAKALPYVPGYEGDMTYVNASNRHGDMAGAVYHQGAALPVLWTDGVPAVLPRLDVTSGSGEVYALNERGHAVGSSMNSRGSRHAALWKNGKVIDLGALGTPDDSPLTESAALAINASGMVVGTSKPFTQQANRAVQWTRGTPASLVDLGAHAYGTGSEATSVNRDGVVVGLSTIGDSWAFIRPIGWINGVPFDLKAPASARISKATGINDAGTVVGTVWDGDPGDTAIVWPHYNDEPVDLNTRLDARGCRNAQGQPDRLTEGRAINNRGEILVTGYIDEYRLVPLN